MDTNTAIAILDLVARNQAANPDDVREAVSTLSNYVTLLEFLSSPAVLADARRDLAILSRRDAASPGLQHALVTILGDEFIVDTYGPQVDEATYRLAEKELSRLLRLRFLKTDSAMSLQRLEDVITAG